MLHSVPRSREMGKPLRAKQINLDKGRREKILKWQGVKANKRVRLGHTGHFGKVDVVPLAGKSSKGGEARSHQEEDAAAAHKPVKIEGRLPGENHRKFLQRVGKETREALANVCIKNRHVSTKRKAYLQGRKDLAKEKKIEAQRCRILDTVSREMRVHDSEAMISLDDAKSSILADMHKDHVRFGEQAERPPQIKISKPLKGLRKEVGINNGHVIGGVPAIPEISGAGKAKREFEMLRQNAVQQYRAMVLKRREGKGQVTLG